jgi:hypothetical protein
MHILNQVFDAFTLGAVLEACCSSIWFYTLEIRVIDAEETVGTQVYKIEVGTPINLAPEIASMSWADCRCGGGL